MRELNATGFMHNRLRMIVASFLVKDLHINWRWGERYFAQHLVDYDPCVNNGNWQWAASTGCDAQPYFRIFNPWLQQQKFDPDLNIFIAGYPNLRRFHRKRSINGIKNTVHAIIPHRLLIMPVRVKLPRRGLKNQLSRTYRSGIWRLNNA